MKILIFVECDPSAKTKGSGGSRSLNRVRVAVMRKPIPVSHSTFSGAVMGVND